jgi:hypothetical protein
MARDGHPPLRITDDIYSPLHTPVNHRTRAQWLRDGYRVVGHHTARLLVLHDRPHNRRKCPEEPLEAQEVESLRLRLEADEFPSDEDRRLILRLDLAGQVSWSHLFAEDAVVPITTPTQSTRIVIRPAASTISRLGLLTIEPTRPIGSPTRAKVTPAENTREATAMAMLPLTRRPAAISPAPGRTVPSRVQPITRG